MLTEGVVVSMHSLVNLTIEEPVWSVSNLNAVCAHKLLVLFQRDLF